MLMKYNDLKKMSADEMKEVRGGNNNQGQSCQNHSDCGEDNCNPPNDADGFSHWECANHVCKFQVCQ